MKLSQPVKLYIGIIIATGSAVIIISIFKSNIYVDSTLIVAITFFLILGAIAESLPVRINGENLISISSVVSIASILLFDIHTAVVLRFFSAILTVRKSQTGYAHLFNTPIYKSLFNGFGRTVTVFLAGLTYWKLSLLIPRPGFIGFNAAGLIGLVVVYFTTDTLLFSILFSLLTKSKLRDEIRNKLWTISYLVLLSPVGVFFAGLYHWQGIFPIILFSGPFLFARHAFEQSVDAKNKLDAQKKIETELRASEEKFSKMFHASPMAVVIQRASDKRYVDVNEGFTLLTGFTPEEALGKTLDELGLYPDKSALKPYLQELLDKGHTRENEFLFRQKNGEIKYGIGWGESIDVGGEAYYMGGVVDITERKQAEIEREKLITQLGIRNAELERLTYTLWHELKSPLVTIRGFLGYMDNSIKLQKWEDVQSDILRISKAADKMNLMIVNLLDVLRAGHVMKISEHIVFEEIIQNAIEPLQDNMNKQKIRLEVKSGFPLVRGDRERLTEVVEALVENAIKYMGDQPEPKITIGIRAEKEEQVFYISDNGIGINPAYHERVFNIFEKLNPLSDGTGIGLSLVKRIIEMHGGKIWVESEGVGFGTTFYFTLPKE